LQALANIVLQHVRDLKGTLSEIHPFASTEWYGTTPLGSTCFVGRIPEMWKLHSILHAGDVAQISGATLAGAYPVIVTGTTGSISHYSEAQLVVQEQVEDSLDKVIEKALRKKPSKLVNTMAVKRILLLERQHMNLPPQKMLDEIEKRKAEFPDLTRVDEIWILETPFYGTAFGGTWARFELYEKGTVVKSFDLDVGS